MEYIMSKKFLTLLIVVFCISVVSFSSQARDKYIIEEPVYLKVNIHYIEYRRVNKACYLNWTDPGKGHKVLPFNTLVKIIKWKKGFKIIDEKNNLEIFFEYDEPRMHMPIKEYLNLITSSSEIDISNLSAKDLKGVKDGKAYTGMTKNGVMIALGYPATFRTFSLERNTWIYWTNRHTPLNVKFDQEGLVKDRAEERLTNHSEYFDLY